MSKELKQDLVGMAQDLKAAQQNSLRAGYEDMAADIDEEREANAWIEGLIGDVE